MSITTLAELFLRVAGQSKPDCLLHKVGGTFQPVSTAELVDRVRRLAKALAGTGESGGLGVAPGDRVALMSENGPHWPLVDFATLCTGAVLVPIYPTLLPDQAVYIANDCGAKVVFAETPQHLEGFLSLAGQLPNVQHFVLIQGQSGPASDPKVITLAQLLERGAGYDINQFETTAKAVKKDDLATFIYTSGTTGQPKGVMLTHDNIVSNIVDSLPAIDVKGEYTALSFLPLSHSFERTVDYIYFHNGCSIAYAESVAAVAQNLQEVRPQVFVSVPRVYEKVLSRVLENVAAGSPTKQKIFAWAQGVAKQSLPYRLQHKSPPGFLGLKLALADKLVFAKIRERLGGRFKFAVSGGAPLARDVAEFFWGAGIEIYEGYGLSETSPVISVNTPDAVKMGSVGKPIRGVEVKIAADGEILSRGRNTMKGYWNLPDATKEAIDADGWFHTGDIGEIDAEGFLRITDRKKELIINAYGKNIAPAPIENALKASRFIAQAVVIGDRRKFLSALLVPDFDAFKAWAERHGLDTKQDVRAQLAMPQVRELFAGEVKAVNSQLAHYEHISAWELLPAEWTLETGELTPTQKVKRRVINQKYGEVIEDLYKQAEAAGAGR
jgi:long-chain acyl-CoA synthetase